MLEDSVLIEVHKAKDELGAKYDYDIKRMAAAFRENQRKRGRKVVALRRTQGGDTELVARAT